MKQDDGCELYKLRFIRERYDARRFMSPLSSAIIARRVKSDTASKDGYLLARSQRARSSRELKSSRASPSSSIFDSGSFRTLFC